MANYIFRFLKADGQLSMTTGADCGDDEVAILRAALSMDRQCHAIEVISETTGETIWAGLYDDALNKLAESVSHPRFVA